jgi:hypothetical protein
MQYIKDHMGRFIGTQRTENGKTTVRDFKSGNIVATYNQSSNKTIDWKRNTTTSGDVAITKLRK